MIQKYTSSLLTLSNIARSSSIISPFKKHSGMLVQSYMQSSHIASKCSFENSSSQGANANYMIRFFSSQNHYNENNSHHKEKNERIKNIVFYYVSITGILGIISKLDNRQESDQSFNPVKQAFAGILVPPYALFNFCNALENKLNLNKRVNASLELKEAILNNVVESAQNALKKGADVDFPNGAIDTHAHCVEITHLFTLACEKGNIEIVELMLDKHPAQDLRRNGFHKDGGFGSSIAYHLCSKNWDANDETKLNSTSQIIQLLVKHQPRSVNVGVLNYALRTNDFILYKTCFEATNREVRENFLANSFMVDRKNEFNERFKTSSSVELS